MAARTLPDPGADLPKEAVPGLPSAVVHAHQPHLPQMHRLAAYIDVGADEVHQPQLRLDLRNIRHAAARPPQIDVDALAVEHRGVVETALLDRQAQRLERPRGNLYLVHRAVDRLEGRGLENDIRIEGVHPVDQRPGARPECGIGQRRLVAPAVDRAADKLGARASDQLHVGLLVGIGPIVAEGVDGQELRHGDGTRQIALQNGLRDRAVEAVGIFGRTAARGEQQKSGIEQSFHGIGRYSFFHNRLIVSSVERPVGVASLAVLQR